MKKSNTSISRTIESETKKRAPRTREQSETDIVSLPAKTLSEEEADAALMPFINAMFKAVCEPEERQLVIVCFGTTAISGDSLGPVVGTMLREKYNVPAFVYGTEEHTVNGKNMTEWINFITSVHKDALIIAIDASLGRAEKVGQIVFRSDGVCPAAIKGKRTRFGDVGILAVVAPSGDDPLMQLMQVEQSFILEIANKVSALVKNAIVR